MYVGDDPLLWNSKPAMLCRKAALPDEGNLALATSGKHACYASFLQSCDITRINQSQHQEVRGLTSAGCCRRAAGVLDLTGKLRPWMAARPTVRAKDLGLSTLAAAILGHPINKALQTSDWRRRPLSAAQLRYAAIDAHAAVRMFDQMWSHLREAERIAVRRAVTNESSQGGNRTPQA